MLRHFGSLVLTALAGFAPGCTATQSDPAALPLAAAQLLQARMTTEGGAEHAPGTVAIANGERVPYDRYLLVGSELGQDRGTAYAAFLREIVERGGTYRVLEQRQDGSPIKVLMVVDDVRVVVSVLRW
jgi:hypothetical protein